MYTKSIYSAIVIFHDQYTEVSMMYIHILSFFQKKNSDRSVS